MPELNPQHVQAVLKIINQSPFFRHLSMVIKDVGVGYSLVELEIGEKHLNPFRGLHGGVYASVIDTAAYWAVYGELAEETGFISVDLKVDYLAPANSGKLTIKGRSIKIGRTMCLAEATVLDQNDRQLAHGVSKLMVVKNLQTIKAAADMADEKFLPPKFL
ncbi:MAG: PaaI family thioesterase [Syntrophales bacterium]